MRIKEIKIAGEIVTNFITIQRREMKPLLVMLYKNSGVSGKIDVLKGDSARWAAAKYIQEFLDGYEGTQTDVKEYFDLLERVA
jgi:hypothetical protein